MKDLTCPSGERVLRGGDRSESDPRPPCGFLLGGERSKSEPLPFWPLFLGGDKSESAPCRPWGRLRGGDWSESESFRARLLGGERSPAAADFVFFLCGDSETANIDEIFWAHHRGIYTHMMMNVFVPLLCCLWILEGEPLLLFLGGEGDEESCRLFL